MGVIFTVEVGAAPQAGVQQIKCSVPASLAAFDSLAVNTNPGGTFITVTKVSESDTTITEAARVNVSRIIDVVGTTAF